MSSQADLAAARARGRVGGRQRRMTPGKVESARALRAGGMPPREVAHNLGVSVPTLYRWLPAGGAGRRSAVTRGLTGRRQQRLHLFWQAWLRGDDELRAKFSDRVRGPLPGWGQERCTV